MKFGIVRLQVQSEPLKTGKAPLRQYDPSAIESVHRLEVTPSGVAGLAEQLGSVLDVHHTDHPMSRDRKGTAGLTLMGTGDYVRLQERYGNHLTEGIAGETILLDAPQGLAGLDLPTAITVHTRRGPLQLTRVRVADPCVEFSRFCLRQPPEATVNEDVEQALIDQAGGARGYRAAAAAFGTIGLGDQVEVAR